MASEKSTPNSNTLEKFTEEQKKRKELNVMTHSFTQRIEFNMKPVIALCDHTITQTPMVHYCFIGILCEEYVWIERFIKLLEKIP